MKGLVLKDLLLSKKMVLFILAYCGFLFVVFKENISYGFLGGIVAVSYLLLVTTLAYDDKTKSDIMINSLPIERKTVVLSKYLSAIVMLSITLVLFLIMTALFSFAEIADFSDFNASLILNAVILSIILFSLYLPLYFKVGYIKSRYLNIILFLCAFFIPGSIVEYMNKNPDSYLNQIVMSFNNFSQFGINLLAGIGLLLIVAISIFCSVNFYKKRSF